ncbi:tetratricopeptide repeat protein [Streptomyces sp. BPTC-684]|uniref:tetratricopeptide repeat protein n=1 Tax=Streptomyces sp. BPTC-684 TaxID=3043734 RepID=UPI0024B19672|nr:tetratricopeptide repeat protein [Streptomyces sp. BPTC-684]WHM41113.1 tetratricopeptide repeat protein [Streptomyces sp. BPTC-684]
MVVTARDITGPVTITAAGARVPGYLQDPQRWTLVETWDALTAGTHRARPDSAGDAVPPYVARDVDAVLRARLTQAAQRGGLVLVLGESTAGKTRVAHHAVRRCEVLGGYRVLAPDTGPDLVVAVEVVAATAVRCLVWLDDLERFLTPDGLEAGILAELVRLRTPVLATMQLRHYDNFYPRTGETPLEGPIGPDPSGTGARVLKQIEPLHLQRRWSPEELARAQECDDPRIIDAVTHHGPYGVAEYLAAGPALLTEWRHATRPGGHPRGASLVAAAVDLARTGLRPPYPTSLLTTLHHHYLPDDPLLRPEPLDEALAWTGRLRYGATSLLLPTSDPGAWNVFDYLPDHTTSRVADEVWQAALDHATDDNDRFTIGVHAWDTAPHIADDAWRPLVPHVPGAAFHLAYLLDQEGRSEEAEQMYRQAMDAGEAGAKFNLAVLLTNTDRNEEAEQLYRPAIDAGDAAAAVGFAAVLHRAGRNEEAEHLYRQAMHAGHTDAAFHLGNLLAVTGRSEEAEHLYRQASAAGDTYAAVNLALLLADTDRNEEAEHLYRQAMHAGHTDAVFNLAVLLADTDRNEEAEHLYRQAMHAGHTDAVFNLAVLLADTDRNEEAEHLYRQASAAGDFQAAVNLAYLLERAGRSEEIEAVYRENWEALNPY